jgi:putative spermidine/putrescine transport system ATP-binding protein
MVPDDGQPQDAAEHWEPGCIREVVYVGMVTRYLVELDSGGELVVIRQNLETSSQEALEARDTRVRLGWRPEHTFEITSQKEEDEQ